MVPGLAMSVICLRVPDAGGIVFEGGRLGGAFNGVLIVI